MNNSVELAAAEALLDVGISLPLFRFGKKALRITARRPYLGTQMRIAREFLKTGKSAQQIASMTEDQERDFFSKHLHELSMMVAYAICRGYLSGLILAPLVAWLIRWRVPLEYLIEVQRWYRRVQRTKDFTDIIVSAERTNPFRAETSQIKSPANGS